MACGLAAASGDSGFREIPTLPAFDEDARVLRVEPSIRLQEVRPNEIIGHRGTYPAISLGEWRRGSTDFAPLDTRITRTVPALWSMRVPDERAIHTMDVHYEMRSPDDRINVLSPLDGSSSEIRTFIRSLPPVVVTSDHRGALIEGGMMLDLELEGVRTAGVYAGTLTITVDQF